MLKKNHQPLLSFLIISYNNEKFIEEALKSALKQDYDNYEVVVSDDSSRDNTWKIINEVVEKYKRESIAVILNRNEKNLGIVRNFQKAMSMTTGKWVVTMAGDDVSVPDRMKLIEEIILKEEDIYAIGTGYDLISEKGFYISKGNYFNYDEIKLPLYPGFAVAINRDTFTRFPDIKENIQSEDIIYTLRGLELGKIVVASVPTVKHRIHKSNVTSKGISLQAYEGKIVNHLNAIKTLNYYKDYEIRNLKLIPIIERQIFAFEQKIEHYQSVIEFYQINFLKRIFCLNKIILEDEKASKNRFLLRLKIFFESFKITALILSVVLITVKKLLSPFKSSKKGKQTLRVYSI